MGIYRSLAGTVRVLWTGADIAAGLEAMGKQNIPVFSVQPEDEVTVSFSVYRKDYRRLQQLAKRRGDGLKQVSRTGLYWSIRGIMNRPVLLAGLILLLFVGVFLPGRILFVDVEGNQTVPGRLIQEAAQTSGVGFGAARREIRSEQVKNALLGAIPQLQWAGVNTYGCRAVITVRERADTNPAQEQHQVRHITASRDGVITSCTVTRGNGICSVGQAVQEGDILISGYTDCGITITAECADGEIFAETQRDLTVVTPSKWSRRAPTGKNQVKFSLLIGKKRINFYKGSGISGASCDKMYSKYVLTLPGGFSLPLALVKETIVDYSLYEENAPDGTNLLHSFSADYLKAQMIAGTVIRKAEAVEEAEGVFHLSGNYACIESIGTVQEEMIGEFNGKTDGTDRQRGSGG